jgi:predicted phosphoribosyltransferase
MSYRDRRDAGAALARHLTRYASRPDVVVLGLVRGGVPVAAEVARRLGVPLDALVVRKLGVPWAPEVAFGALGPGNLLVLNDRISDRLAPEEISAVVRHEATELVRRERRYRGGRPGLRLDGRTALIVDDGLATGATAKAAVGVARQLGAVHVVLAVPVAPSESLDHLAAHVDEVVCPLTPEHFGAVSRFYDDFGQVSDAEVVAALTACASGSDRHVDEPGQV